MSIATVRARIHNGLAAVITGQPFLDWFAAEAPANGDWVLLNNSFVYRDKGPRGISTNKSDQYLCIPVTGGTVRRQDVKVVKASSFNPDFKLVRAADTTLSPPVSLAEALRAESAKLAKLLFVLIGEIRDASVSTTFNSAFAAEMSCDSDIVAAAQVNEPVPGAGSIVVQNLIDPDVAWDQLMALKAAEIAADEQNIKTAFSTAFDKLREEARSTLSLPTKATAKHADTLVAKFKTSVQAQCGLYNTAFTNYQADPVANAASLNEVLRIAYNFADDALTLLRLLVSICDLKPMLQWCTFREHYELSQRFKDLPWTSTVKKASLDAYTKTINSARNRAFHNLLAFERTIEADLSNVDVRARRMTLLPEYGKKKSTVAFDYEDREMVEVLAELNRAPETAVSSGFWEKNKEVLIGFLALLTATEDALWEINGVRK